MGEDALRFLQRVGTMTNEAVTQWPNPQSEIRNPKSH